MDKVLIIGGPTASGKSALAILCAERYNGEVVSADARQVYRGLDIGTGKVTREEMHGVKHHMLDVVDPSEVYTAFLYARDAYVCVQDIQGRGKLPIVAGGTGFYIHALRYRNALGREPSDALEERFPHCYITLMPERTELRQAIERRLKARWDGIVDEVVTLHKNGLSYERMDTLGLEYRFISRLVRGLYTEEEAYTLLLHAIYQYAKRQNTWFKKYGGQPFTTANDALAYLDTLYAQ